MRNRRNTIRLNESMLKRIIKESVKRVLRESKRPVRQIRMRSLNESAYFDKEKEMILKQNGLDPRLVAELCRPDIIPVYNSDLVDEDEDDYTDDYGIDVDTEDGTITIHINAADYNSEDEPYFVIATIQDMCDSLKRGNSPEDAWHDVSFYWSL